MNIERIVKEDITAPNIYVTSDKYRLMRKLTEHSDKEIGWLALSKAIKDGYLIYDVLMCDQEVSSVATELDEAGIQKIFKELVENNRADEINNVRCWCHSHVDMPVTASLQDDNTFEEYYKECNDYFIRLIMNKKEELSVDLAEFENGYIYRKLPLYILYEDKEERELHTQVIEYTNKLEELKDKIKQIDEIKDEEFDTLAKAAIKKHVKTLKEKYLPKKHTSYPHFNFDDYENDYWSYLYNRDNIFGENSDQFDIWINTRSGKKKNHIRDIFSIDELDYMCSTTSEDIKKTYKNIMIDGIEIFANYTNNDWRNLQLTAEEYMEDLIAYDYGLQQAN